MCTAYDTVVKDFQTNLASFVNVSCIFDFINGCRVEN